MKLFAIMVLKWRGVEEPVVLASAEDLSSFNYFSRGSVKEFMVFTARTLAKRCAPGTRMQVEEKQYTCYVHSRQDGTAGVVLADAEYPARVALTYLSQCLVEFTEAHRGELEAPRVTDNCIAAPELATSLAKYQDPVEADKILRIQKDLDETKTILHQAMDSLLERGEKLDDLVAKSRDLGDASKNFYKVAKKNNSCCVIL